jgi:transposase
MVEATNNACERALRPAVIQRKVTNGYRAMWAAQGEADIRTVVDTARLGARTNAFKTILQTVRVRFETYAVRARRRVRSITEAA